MDGGTEWRWNDDPEPVVESETQLVQPTAHIGVGRGWNGEKYSGGWTSGDHAIDHLLHLDYFTLRERSEQVFQRNLYARGLIRRLITNEVHTGLSLEADPNTLILGRSEDELEAWSDRVEAFFNAWGSTPRVFDEEQRQEMTMGEMTAAARREALVGGDVLVILRQHPQTKLPTVQLVGGHLVQTPLERSGDIRIEHGVELDATGRHIAYHIRDPRTFEPMRIPAFGARSGRRLAWLMYGTDRRIGEVRGAPLLSIVLQSLQEIDRYRDSTQRKAIINSILSMWIEKTQDKMSSLPLTGGAVKTGTTTLQDDTGTTRAFQFADQIPGLVLEELQQGEKPHAFKVDGTTDGYPEFEAAIIAAIAWASEIPAEILRLSFDKNYSASAAALNEFKLYLTVIRKRIAQSFNQPIYEEWLMSAVMKGTIQAPGLLEATDDVTQFETAAAWVEAAWIGAVKPTTDMLKLVKAFGEAVDRGWTTNTRIASELTGTKFATNARLLRREAKQLPRVAAAADDPVTVAMLTEPND